MITEIEQGLDVKKMEKQISDYWVKKDCIFQTKKAPHKRKKWNFFDAPLTTITSNRSTELRKEILRDTLTRFWSMNSFLPNPFSIFLPPLSVTFGSHALIEEEKKQMEQVGVWNYPDSIYTISSKKFMNVAWITIKKLYEKNLLYPGKMTSQVCYSCNEISRQRENEQLDVVGMVVKFNFSDGNGSLAVFVLEPKNLLDMCGVSISSKSKYVQFKFGSEQIIAEESVAGCISKNAVKQEVFVKDIIRRNVNNVFSEEFIKTFKTDYLESFKIVLRNPREILHKNKGIKIIVPSISQKDYIIALENNFKIVENVLKFESRNKNSVNGEILKVLDKKQILLKKVTSQIFSQTCLFCGSKTKPLLGNHWMLRTIDFNFELIKSLDSVEFEPVENKDKIKKNLMLTDFPISRAGGSGIPLPFWKCDRCGKIEVIESVSKLGEKSNKNNQYFDIFDLVNGVFIDLVRKTTWGCGNCSNGTMKWVDQILSRSSELAVTPFLMDCDERMFKPINFVLANKVDKMHLLLLFTFAIFKKPFFSKIFFTEYPDLQNKNKLPVMGKSNDALRITSLLNNSSVVDSKSINCADEFISTLLKFHIEMVYFFSFEFNPEFYLGEYSNSMDLWLNSRLNSLSKEVSEAYEKLDFNKAFFELKNFVENDLLDFFIPLAKRKFLTLESKHPEKQATFRSVYDVLVQIAFLLAPMAPFISEKIHFDLVCSINNATTPSIHSKRWPGYAQGKIKSDIEKGVDLIKEIVSVAKVNLFKNKNDFFVPFESAVIFSDVEKVKEAVKENEYVLKFFLNTKKLEVKPLAGSKTVGSVDFSKGKIMLVCGKTKKFEAEGKANKLIKEVEVLRNEINILQKEKIILEISGSKEDIKQIKGFEKNIKLMVNAKNIIFSEKFPVLSSMSKKVNVLGQKIIITIVK